MPDMTWLDSFKEVVNTIFNTPVPIIGVTVGSLALLIFGIISRTSFGKKSIKKLTGMYNEGKEQIDLISAEYKEYKELATTQLATIKEEYETAKSELKTDYENRLALVKKSSNELQELLLKITDHLHNKEISKLVSEYRDAIETEYQDISSVVTAEVNKVQAEASKTIEELRKEVEDLIAALQTEAAQIAADGKATIEEVKEVTEDVREEIESIGTNS